MVTLCAHVHDQHDTAKSIESIVEQLHFDNYDQVHNYISTIADTKKTSD